MRIQEKKDSLEGKEMERGAEREGVTEEIDAVFAVCWFTVISVSQVRCLWVLPCFTPLSSPHSCLFWKEFSLSQFIFKVPYILYCQSINFKNQNNKIKH